MVVKTVAMETLALSSSLDPELVMSIEVNLVIQD